MNLHFPKKIENKIGFTLIELMVSVSIFSMVLLIALGSVLTIIDANIKARTLTAVMNNVNFAFETVTRSVKTGVCPAVSTTNIANDTLTVKEIDLNPATGEFDRRDVIYRFDTTNESVEKSVDGGTVFIPITADEVKVNALSFSLNEANTCDGTNDYVQPITTVFLSGEVQVKDLRSEFNIQTSISQRRLNLKGDES